VDASGHPLPGASDAEGECERRERPSGDQRVDLLYLREDHHPITAAAENLEEGVDEATGFGVPPVMGSYVVGQIVVDVEDARGGGAQTLRGGGV
jgi:hypothetical protein